MAVKIRLARRGAKKKPHYKFVVADARAPRDGSFIEELGYYAVMLSKDDPNRIKIKKDRVEYWLANGAQTTDRVAKLLKNSGIELPHFIKKRMTKLESNYAARIEKYKQEKTKEEEKAG